MRKIMGFQKALLLFLSITISLGLNAQIKAFPPHWWQGFDNDTLEILLHNPNGFSEKIQIKNSPQLLEIKKAPNTEYAYATFKINDFYGSFIIKHKNQKLTYHIKKRDNYAPTGLSQADAIYLITPDRFANGNPKNDSLGGMNEKTYDRNAIYGRHGGDIKGIINRLDYIKGTGYSALWISPMLTNDQFQASYHGYAITDHYNIDPRFGDNALYKNLVDELHRHDMKIIMDVVYNHTGSEHHLFKSPPDSNFFHYQNHQKPPRTNYRAVSIFDPHVANSDYKKFNNGWFDGHMPDVNQHNVHMRRFLIQNSIWWVEEFNIDGFRMDTYTYSDPKFMADLAKSIKREYPDFFSFGEVWVHGPEIQSYFAGGNASNPLETHIDAVADFQMYYAINEALNQPQSWNQGIEKVYYRLAADYMYENPYDLVTFLDNHDEGRFFGHIHKDLQKFKVGIGMLYTMRGIPCTYYGTEILLHQTENHGVIREDFPGGWKSDKTNKFLEKGRTEQEREAYDYIKKLLDWRKTSAAVSLGKLKHFAPVNNIYVYVRYYEGDRVLVVVNTDQEKSQSIDLNNYGELWPKGTQATNILTGEKLMQSQITLPPMSIIILDNLN